VDVSGALSDPIPEPALNPPSGVGICAAGHFPSAADPALRTCAY